MAELQDNGRESLVSLGEKVGLKHPSVRDCISRLVREGVMKVQANINPRKLNLHMAHPEQI
ncbi:MAG: winged helix-turn-helix transcriptional regulator [Candidatus Baldrarchaeia archaeon]